MVDDQLKRRADKIDERLRKADTGASKGGNTKAAEPKDWTETRDPARPPVGLPMNQWSHEQLAAEKRFLQQAFTPRATASHLQGEGFARACQARGKRYTGLKED